MLHTGSNHESNEIWALCIIWVHISNVAQYMQTETQNHVYALNNWPNEKKNVVDDKRLWWQENVQINLKLHELTASSLTHSWLPYPLGISEKMHPNIFVSLDRGHRFRKRDQQKTNLFWHKGDGPHLFSCVSFALLNVQMKKEIGLLIHFGWSIGFCVCVKGIKEAKKTVFVIRFRMSKINRPIV